MNRKLLLLCLVCLFTFSGYAQNFPTSKWIDQADTTWFDNSQNTYDIADAQSFAGVSLLVSQGHDFDGKTINITADINLDGHLWLPIGVDIDHQFKGDVNGNNHTISNLWVNRPSNDFSGLFGAVMTVTIQNLNLDTATVYGKSTVGAMIANLSTNSSAVDCHVTNGYVHCEGGQYGGIAGGLAGGLLVNSTISRCSFSGEVHGGAQLGGLVGTTWSNTLVEESFSTGIVKGDDIVGGLIGYTTMNFPPDPSVENVVRNCYSRSAVTASGFYAGGLFAFPETTGIIENCYSTGTVQGVQKIGGSIGAIQGETSVTNTYFDTETSGMTAGIGSPNSPLPLDVTGLTTAEMTAQSFVDSLNATSTIVWSIDPTINDGYPILANNTLAVTPVTQQEVSIVIYPTVTHAVVNFQTEMPAKFTVFNMQGRQIDQGQVSAQGKSYNVANLSTGIYLVVFETATQRATKRFIKQ